MKVRKFKMCDCLLRVDWMIGIRYIVDTFEINSVDRC